MTVSDGLGTAPVVRLAKPETHGETWYVVNTKYDSTVQSLAADPITGTAPSAHTPVSTKF